MSDLEQERPGESQVQEIREANPLPVDDEGRMKFREELAKEIEGADLSETLKTKLDQFMKMHHLEMMTRLSFDISLGNRNLVFEGFQKTLPNVKPEKCVNLGMAMIEFTRVRDELIKMNTMACDHFNRSCELLQDIETIANDAAKTPAKREAEGRVLLLDLIALHKGVQGTARRHY